MDKSYLCRDINGDVHIVSKAKLVQRSSAYAVIRGKNGVLLVGDRTRSDDKWDLPGGGIDPDETPSEAVKREVKEEVGLDIVGDTKEICEFIEYFYDLDSQNGWESTRYFYAVTVTGPPQMAGNGDDIVEARYFTEPLSANDVAPVAREIAGMAARSEL